MANLRFEYSSDKQITAIAVQEVGNFLWLAFAQNSAGNCIIEKEFAFKPDQTFFSLERSVDKIVSFSIDANNLYVAYNDSTLLGEIISLSNPLTSTTTIARPGGLTENPVDVEVDGTDLWYLIPGDASGTNSSIIRYNLSGVFQETVDLSKSGTIINNAKSFSIDSNSDIWIVTFTSPAQLVRVFEISGGIFEFAVTNIV